jgi:[ribosomal protein S5]-alanine N-acetyltransferase
MERYEGERVYLRFWHESDAEELYELTARNRQQVEQYSPPRPPESYTVEGQRAVIVRDNDRRQNDQRYSFGIFLHETDELIGSIMVMNVTRGPLQTCMIGYYMDERQNGKGYMTEAVRLIVKYAFEELGLHRVEAGVMPRNIGSVRVLEKGGFAIEGTLRQNLKINGVWEDHYMLSIINEGQE